MFKVISKVTLSNCDIDSSTELGLSKSRFVTIYVTMKCDIMVPTKWGHPFRWAKRSQERDFLSLDKSKLSQIKQPLQNINFRSRENNINQHIWNYVRILESALIAIDGSQSEKEKSLDDNNFHRIIVELPAFCRKWKQTIWNSRCKCAGRVKTLQT